MSAVWRAVLTFQLFFHAPAFASEDSRSSIPVSQGITLRQQGELQKSIDLLTAASQAADSSEMKGQAAGELGISLMQSHRHEQATAPLQKAYSLLSGPDRAATTYLSSSAWPNPDRL